MFYDYYLIPIELSQWVVTNKYWRQFQVYIYLKSISNGVIHIDSNLVKYIAKQLNIKSVKTVYKAINQLEESNWLGIQKKTKKCYVRGFKNIQNQLGLERRIATIFYKTDILDIKAFLIASVMSNLVTQGRLKARRKEALNKGKAFQSLRSRSLYHPIANKVLSNVFDVSMATASRYKSLASKTGYVNIRPVYEKVKINKTQIMLNNKYADIKIYRTKKGIPVIQKPDLVKSNIDLRRRRK